MKICYKGVREENGKYYIATTHCDYRLTYSLHEWVEPKIGKIFVFSRKKDAISYARKKQDWNKSF